MNYKSAVISCVCVTRKKPAMLKRAIGCFNAQSYLYKELIIVYEDDDAETIELINNGTICSGENIRILEIKALPKCSLGELRNIAINAARGEFICQWDDDDWFHANRLVYLYNEMTRNDRDGVIMTQWLVFDAIDNKAYISNKRLWEGSVLCRKDILQIKPYENKHMGEDTPTIDYLVSIDCLHLMNDVPGLYIYIYHGTNTWNYDHWKRIFEHSTALSPGASLSVAEILNGKYSVEAGSLLLDKILEMNTSQGEKQVVYAEPSLGQLNYLRHLRLVGAKELPSYVLVEMEMEDIDILAAEKTIAFFLERHESVRTVFPFIEGEIRQVVLPENDDRFKIQFVDVSDQPEPLDKVKSMYFKMAATLFSNIETGPLIKFFLFRSKSGYEFSLLIHHILCDEWSAGIIRKELALFYQAYTSGDLPRIPPMDTQLRNYCQRQNSWLRESREQLISFWRKKLAGFNTLFDINSYYQGYSLRGGKELYKMTDERAATRNGLLQILSHKEGVAYTSIVSGDRFNRIKMLAEYLGCNLPSVIYAALYVFLYTYTGKRWLLFAALVADRFRPEYENIIGCLLGAIYIPKHVPDNIANSEFIREVFFDIMTSHERIIFSQTYLELDEVDNHVSSDLYINYIRKEEILNKNEFPDEKLHVETDRIYYAIDCTIMEYGDGIVFKWKYNDYLFGQSIIEDMVECFEDILGYMSQNSNSTIRETGNCCRTKSIGYV